MEAAGHTSLRISSLLGVIALWASGAAQASVITYQINFTRTGGGLPSTPTGSFSYDNASGLFSAFQVQWATYSMDLTARANALGATGAGYSCGGVAASKLFIFLTTGVNDCSPSVNRNFAAYQVFPSGSSFILYSDALNGNFAGIRQDNYTSLDSTQNSSGTFVTQQVVPEPSLTFPLTAMAIAFGVGRFRKRTKDLVQLKRASLRAKISSFRCRLD